MNETKTIGYKVGCGFELAMPNDYKICFDVVFPSVYHTTEEANKASDNLFAKLKKVNDEVIIKLYEGVEEVSEIKQAEEGKCKVYSPKFSNQEDCKSSFELISKSFNEIFGDYCAEMDENRAGNAENARRKPPKLLRLKRFNHWLEPVTVIVDVNKILENEDMLLTEELVSEIGFRGVICEETILIDNLVKELVFDPKLYFKGNRLNRTKFEAEILVQDKLRFRRRGFYRFWKFNDGQYFKKVTKENGFHIGYTLRFVKFELEFIEKKKELKVEKPEVANEVIEVDATKDCTDTLVKKNEGEAIDLPEETTADNMEESLEVVEAIVKENQDNVALEFNLDDDEMCFWANVDSRTIIPESFFQPNGKVGA